MKASAIIPARSGSKGIIDKNTTIVCGHPLFAWSIAAAKLVCDIEKVIVSSDSEKILKIAKSYGALPVLRPAELATDEATDHGFLRHIYETGEVNTDEFIVLLRPTVPNRTPDEITEYLKEFRDASATSLRTLKNVEKTPYKMWRCNENGTIEPLLNDIYGAHNHPRQKLPSVYQHDGNVDIFSHSAVFDENLLGDMAIGLMSVNPDRITDIDTPSDLTHAEKHLKTNDQLVNYLNEHYSNNTNL